MIDLKAKPFHLNEEGIQWVADTLASMDLVTKVGQLFCPIGFTDEKEHLAQLTKGVKIGGIMYRPGPGDKVQETHRYLQETSDIPLLIAANLEAGGNGSAVDGTFFGKQLQVAATDNTEMARKLGTIAAREGGAVGCNWAFAPILDIDYNFRNPITNVRTFGSDPERVARMSKAYTEAIQEHGMAVSIKHFPGDGVDERDQHLLTSINSLSIEEWDATFGKVYQDCIEAGAHTVMVGHIAHPAYSRHLRPGIEDTEIMPATLAPELLNGLLREKLGFNGLITTDATPMAGFTMAMKRELAVPTSIAAGCDMFLFNKSLEEDFAYMMKGIENGILTEARVDEAVTRILGVKAALGLHRKKQEGTLVPGKEALSVLRCEEHVRWAQECADQSVTLVKDTQQLLPISPERHKRLLLFTLGGEEGLFGGTDVAPYFISKLEAEGFEVKLYDKKNIDLSAMFSGVKALTDHYDAAVYFSSLETHSNQTVVRINWAPPFGSDMPWFIPELPTVFISVANPYHLLDVPRVPTFINAYSPSDYVVDALIEKLLGRSSFTGVNPIDPFCGYWDTRL
ncbi:glycoside hydrolase family 3 protein [Paenibacillus sp. LMG 31458]|uniref:beta-N-acetylhexosaminidase n=1 Tax=Paenibacillus phytorum TaxID=2654977 RepID=A0ABX1Y0M7_9BACL|nr:glycoside hydrolase family 3 N-terminal domain-containing protein [Paenibacillus phytorum]NOU73836.1 glycoside hydrolase family 3 protein [Paenibacillus phytorum]